MNTLPTTRNVLIAVDVQNDFINGSLAVKNGLDVVQPINKASEAVRQSDGQNIFTRDWHPATTPHFDAWPVHCVAETEGAAFHRDLNVSDADIILSKGMAQTDGYSGWKGVAQDGQRLEQIVAPTTPHERVRVFLGGIATDYCVKATALDIAERFGDDERIALYLLRDAVKAVNLQPDDEARALRDMEAARFQAITAIDAVHLIEGERS